MSSIHASLKLLYSLCFSTYIKIVYSTWFYWPSTTTLTYKVFIWTMFVTQSFGFKITYFGHLHWQQKMPPPCLLYRIWNNVRILTFKVSKWLYPSSWYDRNIGKWRQCLLSIQNETKKIILILSCHRYKVQGSNQEPKTYFWNPSRFGLVGVPLVTIVDHFDTKQSMSCFEPSPTEEGPKAPRRVLPRT